MHNLAVAVVAAARLLAFGLTDARRVGVTDEIEIFRENRFESFCGDDLTGQKVNNFEFVKE